MGSFKIVLTEKAKGHLEELYSYIADTLGERNTAERYINVLSDAVLSLDEMPMRYKLIEDEPHRSRGLRRMLVKNFYVYYSVDTESYVVTVYAFIYAYRDQNTAIDK